MVFTHRHVCFGCIWKFYAKWKDFSHVIGQFFFSKQEDVWWELMKFIALKVVVPNCWMNQYSLTSTYIQLFSCVRGFLASQALNNDQTVWKYQQTLQLQSTENCMKLTFYEYRTKHKQICMQCTICMFFVFCIHFVCSNYLRGLVKNKFPHAFSLSGVGFLWSTRSLTLCKTIGWCLNCSKWYISKWAP